MLDLGTMLTEAQKYARGKTAKVLRRCPDDVDDVLQAAAVKAVEHASDFRGESQFRVWFTTIAINQALMHLRKVRTIERRTASLDVSPQEGVDVWEFPSRKPTPEEEVAGREICRVVAQEAAKMGPALREEFWQMVVGTRNYSDNVRKSRRFRVRKILEKALRERGMYGA